MCTESITVIRELGVQLDTLYYSGKEEHTFIDKTRIKSIIINEGLFSMRHQFSGPHFASGVTQYKIIFYMAFIVEGKNRMILAFRVWAMHFL